MGRWPLIARDRELATIRTALAAGSGRAGVVITGSAGVGKTRLAEEAVAGAGRGTVLRLTGTPAAQQIPLAAVLCTFPELSGRPDEAIAALHARLAGRRAPPMLLVDDVQWLDTSTQTLLHLLVRGQTGRVVATARDDLPIPPTILHLWKDGLLDRIDLAPLEPAGSAQLIREFVGAPVEAAAVADLHARAGGLPLALRELVAEALASRALVVVDGLGRMTGPLPPPRHLLDVIAANLERSQPAWREILATVAIAEPVTTDLLVRVVDTAELTIAEKEGLVRIDGSRLAGSAAQVVTLGHPLYGEAALATLTPLHRRSIVERLVDASAELADRSDAAMLRQAAWCLEIGRPVPVDGVLRATRLTHRMLDADQATSFARALWHERPDFETGILYATTLIRQQHHESASDVLRAAADFAGTEAQVVTRASVANKVLARLGRHDEAIDDLRRAEERVTDRIARAHLVTRRAFTANLAGRTRDALTVIAPVMNSADDAEFREAMLIAPSMLALDGRTDDAMALVARAERLAETCAAALGFVPLPAEMLAMQRGMALYYGGRLADVVQLAEAELRRARESGLSYLLATWLNMLGRAQLDRGHPATAVVTLGAVLAEVPEASGGAMCAIALNALIEAHALLGQHRQARQAWIALQEKPANVPWHPAGLAQLSEGHLAYAEGRPTDAVALFTDAFHRAAPANSSIALTAAHAVARYGHRRPGLDLAHELPPVQGPLAPVRFAHMRALVQGDLAAMVRVAEQFAGLGADLLAAEAWARAADLAIAHGDTRLATRAERAGWPIRARLEGARTPDLMSVALTSTVDLTPREREVALLAAAGLTSQAIATSLTLSIRTIDNNLASVYRKLGIKGRRDLDRALAPR